jgi:hypothetical protein
VGHSPGDETHSSPASSPWPSESGDNSQSVNKGIMGEPRSNAPPPPPLAPVGVVIFGEFVPTPAPLPTLQLRPGVPTPAAMDGLSFDAHART